MTYDDTQCGDQVTKSGSSSEGQCAMLNVDLPIQFHLKEDSVYMHCMSMINAVYFKGANFKYEARFLITAT